MQASAKLPEGKKLPGITPLSVAWLVLLAVATAGATFLILARESSAPRSAGPAAVTLEIADAESDSDSAISDSEEPPGQVPSAPETSTTPLKASETSGAAAPQTAAIEPVANGLSQSIDSSSAEEPPASPALAPSQSALAEGSDLPAWQRYASVYQSAGDQPKIAVVLTGLGLSRQATEAAIKELPPGVTLSFTPYAQQLGQWIALARGNGHEVMLDLPMEPVTYPNEDPGPQTLLTQLDDLQNQERLRWVLSRGQGYVGLAATMGSRFSRSEPNLKPILQEIKDMGLMFLDNRASHESVAGRVAQDLLLPHAINDRTLDDEGAGHLTIDARLVQIERVALSDGASVAMGRPYPATIERLREWVRTLESRGFALVPITALAQDQPKPR